MTTFHFKENEMTDLFEIQEQYDYATATGKSMSYVENKSLAEKIEFLNGMECKYYIVDPSGIVHTNMEQKKKKQKRINKFKDYVSPFIESLEIGKKAELAFGEPFNDFNGLQLQSNICARAFEKWGSKSVVTYINKEKSVVEVIKNHNGRPKSAGMEL